MSLLRRLVERWENERDVHALQTLTWWHLLGHLDESNAASSSAVVERLRGHLAALHVRAGGGQVKWARAPTLTQREAKRILSRLLVPPVPRGRAPSDFQVIVDAAILQHCEGLRGAGKGELGRQYERLANETLPSLAERYQIVSWSPPDVDSIARRHRLLQKGAREPRA